MARSYFCFVSATVDFAFSTLARAATRLARAWLSRASKVEVSRRATTWSFFTRELKSAPRLSTVPETCEPTWTVVTACRVPVAPTTSTMSPRSTVVV